MAFVRSQGGHIALTSGNTNWSLSLTISATLGGEDLFVYVSWGTGTLTDLTTVKLGTVSMGAPVTEVADAADSQSGAWLHQSNVAAGQTTITATGAAGGGAVLLIADLFTGGSSTANDGSHSRVLAANTTNGITTGTPFGANGDLLWGCTMGDTTAGNLNPGTGWTVGVSNNADPNFFGISSMSIYKVLSGADDPTWTLGTNGNYLVGGIAISTSGGVAGPTPYRRMNQTYRRRKSGLIVPRTIFDFGRFRNAA